MHELTKILDAFQVYILHQLQKKKKCSGKFKYVIEKDSRKYLCADLILHWVCYVCNYYLLN